MNKYFRFSCIAVIIFFLLGLIIGIKIKECNHLDDSYDKKVDGLYLRNYNSNEVDKKTDEKDIKGDWVCINVRDMTPKRALAVCRHEVGHEIFAEYCEQSQEGFNRCMEVINDE